MQQYFSKRKENNILFLDKDDIHHIKNVMRMKPGEEILICYDKIIYLCLLCSDFNTASVKSIFKMDTEKIFIRAYIPVLTDEKMSFIIEKGTEMGISEFVPVSFSHSKFVLSKEKEEKKVLRWNKISKEASEQSRRLIIPEVKNIIKVDSVKRLDGVNVLCSLDKNNVKPIKEVLNEDTLCDRISLVFGPEGGISCEEENILEHAGFIKTTLGNNILRTETVIVNFCSIINYLNG